MFITYHIEVLYQFTNKTMTQVMNSVKICNIKEAFNSALKVIDMTLHATCMCCKNYDIQNNTHHKTEYYLS